MQGHASGSPRVLFRRSGTTTIKEVMTHLAATPGTLVSTQGSSPPAALQPATPRSTQLTAQTTSIAPEQAMGNNPLDEAPQWVQLTSDALTIDPEAAASLQLSFTGQSALIDPVAACMILHADCFDTAYAASLLSVSIVTLISALPHPA